MSSITDAPEVSSDLELEKLACSPERPLFPVLKSAAEAMFPLAVALAFLPALYSIANRRLTEEGALQGLESLRLLSLSAGANSDFSAGFLQLQKLRFQPPLMSWLTAMSMKVFGAGSDAGLVASSYLCTVGQLLASYALARRLGGEILAFLTVALLAFHPLILAGAQQPVPEAAATMFGLLALAGMIAHWQKSPSLISYQMLLGGIALGLCLLAGGPLALAIVVILLLHVAAWKLQSRWRQELPSVWDRGKFSRQTAFRAVFLLAATAFALAGWHVLLLNSSSGSEFWRAWLLPRAGYPAAALTGPRSVLADWPELTALTFPFLGLTLLGLYAVIRDLTQGREDLARRHQFILIPWIAVALLACHWTDGAGQPGGSTTLLWQAFLAVPLVVAAALGFMEIADRRFGTEPVVAAGLLALAKIGLVTWPAALHSERDPAAAAESIRQAVVQPWLGLFLLAGLGVALTRFARHDETRRRWVLSGVLILIVVLNCWWGTRVPRDSGVGDRDLREIRAGLTKLSEVKHLTFVELPRPGPEPAPTPPSRLIFGLVRQWPRATFHFVGSWEQTLTPGDAGNRGEGTTLLITWSPRGGARGLIPHATLKLAAPPFLFEDQEVAVYVREK
jgi:4-amino-4-deoxy-L-arabinose transferase-like glycosyltransferase